MGKVRHWGFSHLPEVLELVSGGAQSPAQAGECRSHKLWASQYTPRGFWSRSVSGTVRTDSWQHWGPFSHSTVFSGSLTFLSWMRVYFRSAFQMVESSPSFLSRAVWVPASWRACEAPAPEQPASHFPVTLQSLGRTSGCFEEEFGWKCWPEVNFVFLPLVHGYEMP